MGPVDVGRVDLNLFGGVSIAEKAEVGDVVVSECFSEVLVGSHSDRGQFPPESIVSVVVVVEVVARAVSEHTDDLLQPAVDLAHHRQKQKSNQHIISLL